MSGRRTKILRQVFEYQNPGLCRTPDYRQSKAYKSAWRLFKKLIMVHL